MLGRVIAANSSAALAFDDQDGASEILSAVRVDQHIQAVALYDEAGELFASYSRNPEEETFPQYAGQNGYYFHDSFLIGYEPVVQGERAMGALFLKSDMQPIYERLTLYAVTALGVIALALLAAFLLSRRFQREISMPILRLAETARAISHRNNYSVRATKVSNDEIGLLTDAFNQMLSTIESQTEEIMSFSQRLEERVVERTRELQAANRELEAFSYSVSHDLRAPLRSIHGYMKIFNEEYSSRLDQEGKRLIGIILKNGSRMGQLIDDLLTFSQLGRKDLRKGRVMMKSLIQQVWNEQMENEQHRKVKFTLHNVPPAIADSSTMKQVWANLISNATKYTQHREVANIEIGSVVENGIVVYYIKDNGAGFEMKYYDKLFGVFQRLHSEEEFTGTGVGLAIVERIISKHGGDVWAESQPDQGATFYFSLEKTGRTTRPNF